MTSNGSADNALLRRLADHNDESATAALFIHLYRLSPELRHWLREDYARDASLRARLDDLATNTEAAAFVRFADFTEDASSWREEQRRLKTEMSGRFYGGLTWNEISELVHHHQAGTLDLGTFLLVREWREVGQPSPSLIWAGLALLESILPSGRRRLLKHLHEALSFVKKFENSKKRRAVIGYADWWKLHALFFMVRHPRPSYRTRDFRAHLARLGLDVSTKDIRRFCARHGIRRDMRGGRPRKKV